MSIERRFIHLLLVGLLLTLLLRSLIGGQGGQAWPGPNSPLRVVATGIPWPQRSSGGQTSLPLQIAGDPALADVYPYAMLYRLPVEIGDSLQQLVVDTGASNSVISQQIAEQLDLSSTPVARDVVDSVVVGDRCPDANFSLYQLPAVSVGDAQVDGLTALGLPFQTNPVGTAGVLGMDFLSEFDLIIHPIGADEGQFELRSPSAIAPADNSDTIPLRGRLGLMIGDLAINDQGPVPFMIDTGAALTVLSPRLVPQIGLDLSQAQPIDVIGFCGMERGQFLRLSRVALQGHQVENLEVIVLDTPALSVLNVDGILGQNFLNRYRQHWRFAESDENGFPQRGSLHLTALD